MVNIKILNKKLTYYENLIEYAIFFYEYDIKNDHELIDSISFKNLQDANEAFNLISQVIDNTKYFISLEKIKEDNFYSLKSTQKY